MAARGLVIAGLSSGSGKTTITLGLLRALQRQGYDISPAKTGPDYIDAAFLSAASGKKAVNLDAFAMHEDMVRSLASNCEGETLIIEGVMGLFDGTIGGAGSTAHLAQLLHLPVVLVIDARHQAQTAAAIASGMRHELGENATVAGVILNRIASPRHLNLIADALAKRDIPLLGALPADHNITIPSRHLGLVQAADLTAMGQLDHIIDSAADLMTAHIDLSKLLAAAKPMAAATANHNGDIKAPGQRIAVAQDVAFGFSYTHMLDKWKQDGAEVLPFSPLKDEAPASDVDFVFLPGGYPELHLPTLSKAANFMTGVRDLATRGIPIYGECGGFMTLGNAVIDKDGTRFEMLGLLDLETSFSQRKLNLGYRYLTPVETLTWLDSRQTHLTAHEFHYTTAIKQSGSPLFHAHNAAGESLGSIGLVKGSVSGSYAHIIA